MELITLILWKHFHTATNSIKIYLKVELCKDNHLDEKKNQETAVEKDTKTGGKYADKLFETRQTFS